MGRRGKGGMLGGGAETAPIWRKEKEPLRRKKWGLFSTMPSSFLTVVVVMERLSLLSLLWDGVPCAAFFGMKCTVTCNFLSKFCSCFFSFFPPTSSLSRLLLFYNSSSLPKGDDEAGREELMWKFFLLYFLREKGRTNVWGGGIMRGRFVAARRGKYKRNIPPYLELVGVGLCVGVARLVGDQHPGD